MAAVCSTPAVKLLQVGGSPRALRPSTCKRRAEYERLCKQSKPPLIVNGGTFAESSDALIGKEIRQREFIDERQVQGARRQAFETVEMISGAAVRARRNNKCSPTSISTQNTSRAKAVRRIAENRYIDNDEDGYSSDSTQIAPTEDNPAVVHPATSATDHASAVANASQDSRSGRGNSGRTQLCNGKMAIVPGTTRNLLPSAFGNEYGHNVAIPESSTARTSGNDPIKSKHRGNSIRRVRVEGLLISPKKTDLDVSSTAQRAQNEHKRSPQDGENGRQSKRQRTTKAREDQADNETQTTMEPQRSSARAKKGKELSQSIFATMRTETDSEYSEYFRLYEENLRQSWIDLDNHVKSREEDLYRTMMSRPWDADAIINKARTAFRQKKAVEAANAAGALQPRGGAAIKSSIKSSSPKRIRNAKPVRVVTNEEDRLKGRNLGKAFDPPTEGKRVSKKRRIFGE